MESLITLMRQGVRVGSPERWPSRVQCDGHALQYNTPSCTSQTKAKEKTSRPVARVRETFIGVCLDCDPSPATRGRIYEYADMACTHGATNDPFWKLTTRCVQRPIVCTMVNVKFLKVAKILAILMIMMTTCLRGMKRRKNTLH